MLEMKLRRKCNSDVVTTPTVGGWRVAHAMTRTDTVLLDRHVTASTQCQCRGSKGGGRRRVVILSPGDKLQH